MQTEQLTQVHLGDDHGETRPISQQNFDVASFSSEEARFQEKLLNLYALQISGPRLRTRQDVRDLY